MSPSQWLDKYREIWAVDFEFTARPGEHPAPICLVAMELRAGRIVKLWEDEFASATEPPYCISDECLFLAYAAAAELGCHLALGWALPENIIDLYAEFRVQTNGDPKAEGGGLLNALTYFGLDAIGAEEKAEMRGLAIRGGPWTCEERVALLKYCESDTRALSRLLPRMSDAIEAGAALFRGKYVAAMSRIEARGIPIDVDLLERIRSNREVLLRRLVEEVDRNYGVFDGIQFKNDQWEKYLRRENLIGVWPTTDKSGAPKLDRETFKMMSLLFPQVEQLRQLRKTMSQLKEFSLPVGVDGRNRTSGRPFTAKTGRNQPKSSEFPLLMAKWIRSLVKPEPGRALAYIDWSHQEPGIAAALSQDRNMLDAYASGDLYLAFARQAGAAPENATKETHKEVRDRFKRCAIGVLYGMGAGALSRSIGCNVFEGERLIREHKRIYHRFWSWLESRKNEACYKGWIQAKLGWKMRWRYSDKAGTLMNFPMQANGAEMLRVACVLADQLGIEVVAPLHDAILIEASDDAIDVQVDIACRCMAAASAEVLDGFELRTEPEIYRHPGRFVDEQGQKMWELVTRLLPEIESSSAKEDRDA